MDGGPNFTAPKLFGSLGELPDVTPHAKETLGRLKTHSEELFKLLDEETIDNDEVLTKICTITSEWRDLIRENFKDMGSDRNRLKLFHAYQNVLDKVNVVMKEKQLIASKKAAEEAQLARQAEEAQLARQKEGWGGWIARGVINTAAATATLAVGVLNSAANYVLPTSYQDWINSKTDQFIEYSERLLKEKGSGSVTCEHILKGIEDWQQFVEQADLTSKQTDIRIPELKRQVGQELERAEASLADASSINLPPKEIAAKQASVNAMRKHIAIAQAQHRKMKQEVKPDAYEIFGEAQALLFPPEVEKSISEKGDAVVEAALVKGSTLTASLTEGMAAVEESFTQLSLEDVSQKVQESVFQLGERVGNAVQFVTGQANGAIAAIQKGIEGGVQAVVDKGNEAIKQIKSRASVIIVGLTASADGLITSLHQKAVDAKNRLIAGDFSPKNRLGDKYDKTFAELVSDRIPGERVRSAAASQIPKIQANVSTLLEDKNVQRLGLVALRGLEDLCAATADPAADDVVVLGKLRNIEKERSTEKKSGASALDIEPLNLENYKKEVERKVIPRLSRLLAGPADDGMIYKIKVFFAKFFIGAYVRYKDIKILSRLSGLVLNKKFEVGILSQAFGLDTSQLVADKAAKFTIGQLGLDRLGQQSEVVFYYMMDKITEEMDSILKGTSKTEKTPEASPTKEASPLGEAVKNLRKPPPSPLPEGVISLLEKQGTSSLFDVATPINSALAEWRIWMLKTPQTSPKTPPQTP